MSIVVHCNINLGNAMLLTVRDVANLFNVSEKTVYRWINKGTLPTYKINDQYRFNRAELLDWAMSQRINFPSAIFSEPADSSIPAPKLSDALEAGGIHYRVSGSDKQSVLKEMVKFIRLPEEFDREFLLNVLLAREEMVSTAIGDGIAIPHVRTPIVLNIHKPMVIISTT
ncbi:MAG: helix-turn-helix domain-containing protein, partial [Patescibacteria group bacterium]|nr:helix-turn-helix domain-containing protein [Patescibacteria group bacterium]